MNHNLNGVVKLVIVHVEEDKLGPEVGRLASTDDLGDIDTRPEELEVLQHLLGLVL